MSDYLDEVKPHVKPSREDVAKIIAEAALDWVDVGSEIHWHTLDCTNWTAYADEADLILALFPGRTEQEVREEIAAEMEARANTHIELALRFGGYHQGMRSGLQEAARIARGGGQ